MKITKCLCLLLLISFISGCGDQSFDKDSLSFSDQFVLTYGNGDTLTINDPEVMENIIKLIKDNEYEPVDLPDSVGQYFTLQVAENVRYVSTGYLHTENSIYRAQNRDIVLQLFNYILSLE